MTEDFKNCLSQATQTLSYTRPPEDEFEGESFKIVLKSLRLLDRVKIMNEIKNNGNFPFFNIL